MTVVNIKPATESEKTLLGALLLDSSCFDTVKDMICESDFSSDTHAYVYRTICEVKAARGTFDIAMVSDHGTINADYLCVLANDCCSTANIKAHAEIIREKSVSRKLAECSKEVKDTWSKENLNILLEDFEVNNNWFSCRIINALKSEAVYTLKDLLSWCQHQLYNTPNLGIKSISEINRLLELKNLKLNIRPHLQYKDYKSKCKNCISEETSDYYDNQT
jgi:replicative DNA helicase